MLLLHPVDPASSRPSVACSTQESGECLQPLHLTTQHALLFQTALVKALRANDPGPDRDPLSKGLDLLDEASDLTVLGHHALEVLVPEERNRLLAWQMGNNALPHLEVMQTVQVGQKSPEWRIRLLMCALLCNFCIRGQDILIANVVLFLKN